MTQSLFESRRPTGRERSEGQNIDGRREMTQSLFESRRPTGRERSEGQNHEYILFLIGGEG